MDISKKDLLQETGISYGQLYRWKREGLIPESWFVKKSSYTGQETYFPKEKILNRIHAIQQLKDQYSLEELANILSPEVSNRMFHEEDLEEFEEIDVEVAASFMDQMGKDDFTYVEVLIMMILSEWRLLVGIRAEALQDLIDHIMKQLLGITTVEHRLQLLKIENKYYLACLHEDTKGQVPAVTFDDRIQVVKEANLLELSNAMKVKYKEAFQFAFDEEVEHEVIL